MTDSKRCTARYCHNWAMGGHYLCEAHAQQSSRDARIAKEVRDEIRESIRRNNKRRYRMRW